MIPSTFEAIGNELLDLVDGDSYESKRAPLPVGVRSDRIQIGHVTIRIGEVCPVQRVVVSSCLIQSVQLTESNVSHVSR